MRKYVHGVVSFLPICRNSGVLVRNVQGCPQLWSASAGYIHLTRGQTPMVQQTFTFRRPTAWNSLVSALSCNSLSLYFTWVAEQLPFRTATNTTEQWALLQCFCDSGTDLLTYLNTSNCIYWFTISSRVTSLETSLGFSKPVCAAKCFVVTDNNKMHDWMLKIRKPNIQNFNSSPIQLPYIKV